MYKALNVKFVTASVTDYMEQIPESIMMYKPKVKKCLWIISQSQGKHCLRKGYGQIMQNCQILLQQGLNPQPQPDISVGTVAYSASIDCKLAEASLWANRFLETFLLSCSSEYHLIALSSTAPLTWSDEIMSEGRVIALWYCCCFSWVMPALGGNEEYQVIASHCKSEEGGLLGAGLLSRAAICAYLQMGDEVRTDIRFKAQLGASWLANGRLATLGTSAAAISISLIPMGSC